MKDVLGKRNSSMILIRHQGSSHLMDLAEVALHVVQAVLRTLLSFFGNPRVIDGSLQTAGNIVRVFVLLCMRLDVPTVVLVIKDIVGMLLRLLGSV